MEAKKVGVEEAAAVPEVEEGDGADSSDWHKLARERKKKAGLFVCVGDLTVRLVAFSLVLEPAMNLLYSGLENAAQDFELLQRRRAASGKERTYRILEAAAGTLLKQCWSDVGKAMIHFPIELDTDYHTLRARSMLFRCFSGFLCNVQATVKESHETFPILVFRILLGEAHAAAVYQEPHCLRDAFARHFFDMFPKVQDGRSPQALAFLQAVAHEAELESHLKTSYDFDLI